MPSIAEAKYKLFNRAPYFSALLAAIPLFEQPEPPANQVAMLVISTGLPMFTGSEKSV